MCMPPYKLSRTKAIDEDNITTEITYRFYSDR